METIKKNRFRIVTIVAVSKDFIIGDGNQMLWHLPNDLKRLKSITLGNPLIMGRKTFESIGRPLPNRTNFVISNTIKSIDGASVYTNMQDAVDNVPNGEEVVIIGGGYLFRESVDYFNKLVLTVVDCEIDGDVFYPEIDLTDWSLESTIDYKKDEENEYDFSVKTYIKNS